MKVESPGNKTWAEDKNTKDFNWQEVRLVEWKNKGKQTPKVTKS